MCERQEEITCEKIKLFPTIKEDRFKLKLDFLSIVAPLAYNQQSFKIKYSQSKPTGLIKSYLSFIYDSFL